MHRIVEIFQWTKWTIIYSSRLDKNYKFLVVRLRKKHKYETAIIKDVILTWTNFFW